MVLVLCSGPGSDLSEEPVFRMLSRPRWTTESFLGVLPGPLFGSGVGDPLGVLDEVCVDPVGDTPFEGTDRFFVGFAFGDLAVVVDAALATGADLNHGRDMDREVHCPVASRVQTVTGPSTRGRLKRGGAVVGRVPGFGGEPVRCHRCSR